MKQILLASAFLFTSIFSFAQPANDACVNAITITPVTACGTPTTRNLQNATISAPTNTQGSTYDAWFKFTTPINVRSVTLSIPSSGAGLSSVNFFIEAFGTGACPFTTGNSLGTIAEGSNLSLINLTPGTEYYFRVFSTTNPTAAPTNQWNYTVCVSYTAVPANDNCGNAANLTIGTTNSAGTLLNASASSETVGCATGTPDDDVWYRFTTGSTQNYATITLTPDANLNSSGAMLQLYSGTCGSLTSIACGQNELSMNSGLVPSTQYYVRVYSSSAYSTTPAAATAVSNNFSILVTSPSNATTIWAGKTNEIYRQTILSPDNVLADPWEITYGQDNHLWITEAKGYKLNRMNPSTGVKTVVLDVSQSSTFLPLADRTFNAQFNIGTNNPQGGFAGMALHPNFTGTAGGENFVYLGYVHTWNSGINYTSRVVRFLYNHNTNRLESPVSICDTIPGSGDHNSQRMIIAPMTQGGSDYYLFYAVGDMGAGQQFPTSANITRPMKSQLINSYEGKILRFALSDSCSGSGSDRWIPASNPYNNVSPIVGKSAVWNTGQRNNQGFAYNPALNILYGASHGPFSDDEINIIQGFKNYGHPLVIGYADDGNYNGTTTPGVNTSTSAGVPFGYTGGPYTVDGQAAAASTTPPVGNEVTNKNTINASALTKGAYQDPIYSAYPGPATGAGSVSFIWSSATTPAGSTWHSEAWSGLGHYSSNFIPGWKNTLLAAGLKFGRMIRLKLNDAGTAVVKTIPSQPSPQGDTVTFFQSDNRYRDMAFSPNGRDIYLSMDRSAAGSAATVGNPTPTVGSCRGCIVRYEFLGYNPSGTSPFPSTIPNYIPIDSSTSGGCVTATAVTINTANGNNNLWVPITGPNGNIIAEINANGNNLGNVTTSFFTRTGAPVRSSANNSKYMNRNVTINVQNQPSSAVSVRLYVTQKELDDMIATAGSGVTTITNVGVFKNNDACGTAIAGTAAGQTISGRYTQSTFGHALQFNVTSFSSFYFFNASTTLPFDLISFTGKAYNSSSKLEWVVANQLDVESYTVERSTDIRTFEEIGTVKSKDGSGSITYNFTDFDAAAKGTIVYYRIRSNETSGSGKYTQIISINFGSILITSISLMPNPVQNKTTAIINSVADETAQIKVIDNTGRMIKLINVSLVKGKNNIILDMSDLKTGLYYIDVIGKTISEKTKFIKQ